MCSRLCPTLQENPFADKHLIMTVNLDCEVNPMMITTGIISLIHPPCLGHLLNHFALPRISGKQGC